MFFLFILQVTLIQWTKEQNILKIITDVSELGRNDGFLALIQRMLLVKFEELEKSKNSFSSETLILIFINSEVERTYTLHGSKRSTCNLPTIHLSYIKLILHSINEFEGERERENNNFRDILI